MKKYEHYFVHDFVKDEFFVEWVLDPRSSSGYRSLLKSANGVILVTTKRGQKEYLKAAVPFHAGLLALLAAPYGHFFLTSPLVLDVLYKKSAIWLLKNCLFIPFLCALF